MLGPVLLTASRSARTRAAVEGFGPTRKVVDRFVAGETTAEGVAASRDLAAGGLAVTVDHLGEDVTDLAGARAVRDAYLELVTGLAPLADPARGGAAGRAEVSVKLSALGQALGQSLGRSGGQGVDGHDIAERHVTEIAEAADAAGVRVNVDMEDHTTIDSTLAITNRLRERFPTVASVLQANLHRTESDVADLAAAGARVRLVKGAYKEPASVAFQDKADVDAAYRRHVATLMASSATPLVATHDPAMIELAVATAVAARREPSSWELQMLYGIRTDLQRVHADAGRTVRVYVPYGTDWYGYFMRRLAERPANVAFFLKALATG
ncbi:proline dehydrogenase family protein [Nocardioides sp. GY 10127]|uniref:proline dehydrogenase family protein n=1 Tax=Nocardioides sp. GY 10127 TaxID=2569762 RepID=UPI0010A94CA8|nr:proline dehydrogenase family protein [Nocardioides sp. GY 10127]TIC82654.1 proline dehydrogenase [Nocardioides sp. GY 10127]